VVGITKNNKKVNTTQTTSSQKEIEILVEIDSSVLEKKGWNFVAFFQARQSSASEEALQKAMKRASEIEAQAKIRNFAYNSVTYYEVWVREKCANDSTHELSINNRKGSCDA